MSLCGQRRNLTRGDHHGQEGGVEGADVGRLRGKHVVQHKVDQIEQAKDGGPAQVEGCQLPRDGARKVADHALSVQLPRHAHQDSKPEERVPCLQSRTALVAFSQT